MPQNLKQISQENDTKTNAKIQVKDGQFPFAVVTFIDPMLTEIVYHSLDNYAISAQVPRVPHGSNRVAKYSSRHLVECWLPLMVSIRKCENSLYFWACEPFRHPFHCCGSGKTRELKVFRIFTVYSDAPILKSIHEEIYRWRYHKWQLSPATFWCCCYIYYTSKAKCNLW